MARADDAIANTLGVSPALVRQLRAEKLTSGEHYTDDGRVVYTTAGEALLRELLGAQGAAEKKEGAARAVGPFCRGMVSVSNASAAKKEGGAGEVAKKKGPPLVRVVPEEVEATLIKKWRNPIFVRVRLKGGAERDVQVNSSARAQVGMQLRVRLMPDDSCQCAHAGLMPGTRAR